MESHHDPDGEPLDSAPPDWRTDYANLDERRRARHRREAAGASRDITPSLLGDA